MAIASVKEVSRYLQTATEFKESNNQYDNRDLVQADRIIDICRQEKAGHYINAEGGMEIYSKEQFKNSGIALNFLRSNITAYMQFDNEFVPSLSIIDVLMFNSKNDVRQMLHSFELV